MRVVNILFNQKDSASQKIAGVEQSFIDYAAIFSGSGNQVLSVIRSNSPYKSELLKVKSQICEIKLLSNIDIFSILKMILSILIFKPDVMICHSGRAFVFAKIAKFFLKTPIIAINHGSNAHKFLKADYVFNVNSFINGELIRLGKTARTCFVVPNMLQIPDNFVPTSKKTRHNPVVIGGLGRLSGEKSYRIAVIAVAVLKARGIMVDLHLGGSGEREEFLRNLAKELQIENQVKFLGWVKDKKTFFENIDIFVLPSMFETFGIVLLEAMLYKKPIISSNSWGPKDIIEDGVDGLLFSRDNEEEMPELLADRIEKLYKDQEFAEKLAENAYKKLQQKYSFQVVSAYIDGLVKNILKQ